MKITTTYESEDNKKFESENQCMAYEQIMHAVNELISQYPPTDSYAFINGAGYIQHTKEAVEQLKQEYLRLMNAWFKPAEPFTTFNYMAERHCGDSYMNCLNKLIHKIQCIDNENREWGQIYYALNPGTGDLFQFNKTK